MHQSHAFAKAFLARFPIKSDRFISLSAEGAKHLAFKGSKVTMFIKVLAFFALFGPQIRTNEAFRQFGAF